MIFISVLLRLIDFSDIVILCSGPNSCCQQNLKCFDMRLLSPGLFSSKNSNDCQTKLNMFFEPQSSGPKCPICAGLIFEHSLLGKTKLWIKETKRTKSYVDKLMVRLLLSYLLLL